MMEVRYRVYIDSTVVARFMPLDEALILIKGIEEEYFADPYMVVSIAVEEASMPPVARDAGFKGNTESDED